MLDLRTGAIGPERLQLAGEFGGDLLERFGVEDLRGLRERTERGTRAAELLLDIFQFAGLLDGAQRGDDGIEEEQQDVGAVVVEEELAIAGLVAVGADVVKSFEQRHQPVEILQADDVAFGGFRSFACRHASTLPRAAR